MDPNKALENIRKLIDKYHDADERGTSEDFIELTAIADQIIANVEGLDDWLSKGGFHPTEWTPDERMRT